MAAPLSRSALRARDALVLEHLPLADAVASAVARRFFPLVEREDLIQVAREALQHHLRDRVRLVRIPRRLHAADLGVMEVSLKDAVQFNWGFQGQTQGAGTPNEIGIGGFLPLAVGTNSVFFLDALANVNLADIGNYSSIINTKVAGTTISTSTRLGYRWLNNNRSWMFGVNAGYDSRPMATGAADTGVAVTGSRTPFFQQVTAGLEAVSSMWNFNAYALLPVGTTNSLVTIRVGPWIPMGWMWAMPSHPTSKHPLVTTTKTAT